MVGGTGPLGRAVSRLAAAKGLPVETTSRTGAAPLDVSCPDQVRAVLRKEQPHAVLYLVRASRDASEDSARESVAHMVRLAERAADFGARRFVLASSAAVYGDWHQEPRRESDPLEGASTYALEKILAERSLSAIAAERGLSGVSLRIFNVFGPGCRDSLLNSLVEGPPPLLSVTPNFVRDYVHVDDVASALIRSLERDHVTGPVNIGSGQAVDNVTLAAARPSAFRLGDDEVRSFSVADPTRAHAELGWRPLQDPLAYVRGNAEIHGAGYRSKSSSQGDSSGRSCGPSDGDGMTHSVEVIPPR